MGEDYAFVIGRIETELQRNINGDVFILLNTVLYENFFSWEIVVEGKVILEIQFRSWKESEWEYKFLEDFYKINWEKKFPKIEEQRAEQLESNSAFIEALEKDTLAFIKNAFPLLTPDEKNLPLVYFSGGKESMVMHKILKNGKIKSQLLFASVGLDFPDDVEFIKGLAVDKEFLSGDPIYLEIADKERAWKTLKEKGVLKVHDMWCRSELKYPSRNKAVETVYGDREYIALEGSRKYENDFRRGHPMVNFISDIKGYRNSKQVWLHPLAFWNGFDIWAYIFSHNVKINPLYYKGFHRTTCWMCPLVNPFHLRQSLKYGKELWGGVDELEFEKAYEAFSQWNNPF
ncbi:MAG: phosphoadenosine phosphosulfate reductase family protein [Deltaproteobacteria bacterium]|nr:phosphoadenosine phosphosulfate reductase family protein [Deltaproteobacteria bacterium]